MGIFEQNGNNLSGSLLTNTGDYRYLEGNIVDGKLMLNTFDGNHAYVFIASKSGDSLKGDYYAGKLSYESFRALKMKMQKMPRCRIAHLFKGCDKIDFKFPDLNHHLVSPSDEKIQRQSIDPPDFWNMVP